MSLFVIAAYRNNEVKAPLLETIDVIRRHADTLVHSIEVLPLGESAIVQLLQKSFGMDEERAAILARLLREKTLGNPFFLGR